MRKQLLDEARRVKVTDALPHSKKARIQKVILVHAAEEVVHAAFNRVWRKFLLEAFVSWRLNPLRVRKCSRYRRLLRTVLVLGVGCCGPRSARLATVKPSFFVHVPTLFKKCKYRLRQRWALRLMILVPPNTLIVSRLPRSSNSMSALSMPRIPRLGLMLAESSQNPKECIHVETTVGSCQCLRVTVCRVNVLM